MKFVITLIACVIAGNCLNAQSKKIETLNDSAFFSKVKYRLVGPWRGGRSAAVAGSYKNRNTFYFGATGGGVWKTTDA